MASPGELIPDSHESHQFNVVKTNKPSIFDALCFVENQQRWTQPQEPVLVDNSPLFYQFVEIWLSGPTLSESLSKSTVFEIDIYVQKARVKNGYACNIPSFWHWIDNIITAIKKALFVDYCYAIILTCYSVLSSARHYSGTLRDASKAFLVAEHLQLGSGT